MTPCGDLAGQRRFGAPSEETDDTQPTGTTWHSASSPLP